MNLTNSQSVAFFIIFVFFMFFKPAVCALMIGMIALFYTVNSVMFTNKINKTGIECFGKIVSYESDHEGYKTPVIEFETTEGKSFTGKPYLHTSTDLDKFQSYKSNINRNIKIIYDSESPEKFIIKNNSNGFGLILGAVVGLIAIYISVGSLLGYFDIF